MNESKLYTGDFVVNAGRAPVQEADAGEQPDGSGARMAKEPSPAPLFAEAECRDFRSRWDQIQIHFVDDPKRAAEDADHLVAETMKRLAQIFSDEKKNMEAQWSRGDDVSTEGLRVAVQRYRSFFNRLLTM